MLHLNSMNYHWKIFRPSSLLRPDSNSWSDVFIFQTSDDRTRLEHACSVSVPKRIRKKHRSRRPHSPPEPMPRLATPVQWHGSTVSETKLTLKVLHLCTMKLQKDIVLHAIQSCALCKHHPLFVYPSLKPSVTGVYHLPRLCREGLNRKGGKTI